MRVIYRSASKLRLYSNIPSWLRETGSKATVLLLSKLGRSGNLYRFLFALLAWIIFLICIPLQILVFSVSWLHSITLLRLVKWLEPNAKFIQVKTTYSDTEITTLMVTVEGSVPEAGWLKDKVSRVVQKAILTHREGKKLKCTLKNRLGCHIWTKDDQFSLDNHVTITSGTWRGTKLRQDNLPYWLNYMCSQAFPKGRPSWQVTAIPYFDSTRTECYTLLVRIHTLLVPFFSLSDILNCKPSNYELKKAVAKALRFNEPKKAKSRFEESIFKLLEVLDLFCKFLWIVWVTPRIFYIELLSSCRPLTNRDEEESRTLYWYEDVSKDLLVKLKEASGASISTILTSCLTGAFRKYRLETGEQLPDNIPSLFPFHSKEAPAVKGLLPEGIRCLSLPVDVVEAITRLKRVQNMTELEKAKPAKRQISALILRHLLPFIPPFLVKMTAYLLSQKYSTVIDNIFISDSSGTLWDKKVTGIAFWRPLVNDTASSVTFTHYNDKLTISMSCKRQTIQRPDLLVSLFDREVYQLALALNVRIDRKPTPPSSPTRLIKSLYP